MNKPQLIRTIFEKGRGVLRLRPLFIPMRFNKPGGRLRLHPDDYYGFGPDKGAVKERWFSVMWDCGKTQWVDSDDNISLLECLEELGAALVGDELMARHGGFPIHGKFFDYNEPLFHHIHLGFEDAARFGQKGKPEAYYYPPQLNNHSGTFPHTYFGFAPGTTREAVKARLAMWEKSDTRITGLSRAYRLELGTGWYTPPGVLHAPGSYLTYEAQWNSTSGAVYENITAGEVLLPDGLKKFSSDGATLDTDALVNLLDWDVNTDPMYKNHYFRPPIMVAEDANHMEKWITYDNPYFSAKETTVFPGKTVVLKDPAAYGCVLVQGYGTFGNYNAETPQMIRLNQPTADEYFVSEQAAQTGVKIINRSEIEPMVILRHFGDNHLFTSARPTPYSVQ
jgi:hypothetical protein